ncbi:unnamed protein product [Caenorhabditis bovis]|uniref:Uncharacterized protein n=1 Tax=Caenorhabditis bovis TaxID=2654633 RepID=A0A8S1E5D4_9PELO|nr:unnamed protein product [Caenorhabditis bovis]
MHMAFGGIRIERHILDGEIDVVSKEWDNVSSPIRILEHDQRRPRLLTVLPTSTAQKSVMEAMMQHAILHHSEKDLDTIFAYGPAELFTFLNCGILSQFLCASDERLNFLSHQHRRHSAVFHKLFNLEFLSPSKSGHPFTSFHPELPKLKKVTHEKKLADVGLSSRLQYAVRISPRISVRIADRMLGEIGPQSIASYAMFMTLIGKQPSAKIAENCVSELWPLSGAKFDWLQERIGSISDRELEHLYLAVRERVEASPAFSVFCRDLRIKRAV